MMSKTGASVLVVDDEPEMLRALRRGLVAHGYRVFTARNGQEALRLASQQHPDLLLLDLLLPDISGLEVCKQLRKSSATPIIVLSVRGEEHDKVQALDLGADDYVQKPFGMDEVLARIRVALRHSAQTQMGTDPQVQVGPLRIDVDRRQVFMNEEPVSLTPTEYDLLRAFLSHRGKILTRQMLMNLVWGADAETRRHSLHVYVAQLRQKIEPDPLHPRFIQTIPRVGYRFIGDTPS